MAISSPTNCSNNSTERQEKGKDDFVDLQYAKPSATPDQYSEEPWKHCLDPVNAYLSLRVEERSEFLSRLESTQQDRIQHEIDRIAKPRKLFDSNRLKRDLIQELKGSKAEWKAEVGKSAENLIKEAERFLWRIDNDGMSALLEDPAFHSEVMSRVPPGHNIDFPQIEGILSELAPSWYPRLHCKYERRISFFQRLKTWKASTVITTEEPKLSTTISRVSSFFRVISHKAKPTQHTVASEQDVQTQTTETSMVTDDCIEPEPLYDLKACAMYFKKAKDKDTWVGFNSSHRRYTGEFPNQKISMHEILNEPDDNPLMQGCPPDEIRYFHFPTNNMSWIEVRINELKPRRSC